MKIDGEKTKKDYHLIFAFEAVRECMQRDSIRRCGVKIKIININQKLVSLPIAGMGSMCCWSL